MIFSQRTYDVLKWIAMVALPAVASAYYILGGVWNLPYTGEVVATLTVIDTLLGALLGISSETYKRSDARFDGNLNVIKGDASLINQLEIKTDPTQLAKQDELILRVNKVDIPIDESLLNSPPRQ